MLLRWAVKAPWRNDLGSFHRREQEATRRWPRRMSFPLRRHDRKDSPRRPTVNPANSFWTGHPGLYLRVAEPEAAVTPAALLSKHTERKAFDWDDT
jgi:hypothetical protein